MAFCMAFFPIHGCPRGIKELNKILTCPFLENTDHGDPAEPPFLVTELPGYSPKKIHYNERITCASHSAGGVRLDLFNIERFRERIT